MTRTSETAENWSVLCRKPPAVHVPQPCIGIPWESDHEGLPEGGSRGSGTIRRGIGAALSGMRTLNQNRQILWFTLLAGLLLAGNSISHGILGYIAWTMLSSETEWLVLNFIIEFATLFCLVFLLTGLVLNISSKKEGQTSFFEGLTGAKNYLKAIFSWSFVLALAGMLLFIIYFYSPDWLPRNHLFPNILGTLFGYLINPLMEFPFNPTLTLYTFFDPSGYREFSLVSWIYPSGIMQALIFSEINLLLFILTPFVVPFIVLEHKTLMEAVVASFPMMKKNWDEIASCIIFLLVVTSGVFLTYLLFQAVSGMSTPDEIISIRPENIWIALALMYDIALFCFAIVMATVGGIAALDLYTSAKSRDVSVKYTEPTGVVI